MRFSESGKQLAVCSDLGELSIYGVSEEEFIPRASEKRPTNLVTGFIKAFQTDNTEKVFKLKPHENYSTSHSFSSSSGFFYQRERA